MVFPCTVSNFPCRYLGVFLSLKRMSRADEQPLIDAVAARILTWNAGLLTNVGRVTLTRATLSTIPIHLSIACCLSPWTISHIDKRRRAFIWTSNDSCSGGKCHLAWPLVCQPMELGGLGLIYLRVFGYALRLRWEWLSRSEPELGGLGLIYLRCWASLLSRTEPNIASMCAASISMVVGNGTSMRMWTDNQARL